KNRDHSDEDKNWHIILRHGSLLLACSSIQRSNTEYYRSPRATSRERAANKKIFLRSQPSIRHHKNSPRQLRFERLFTVVSAQNTIFPRQQIRIPLCEVLP